MFKKTLTLLSAFLFAATAFAAVEANKASADELDSLKGIGPVMAKRIVDERSKNGNFKNWDDFVARVKGAGGGAAAKLSAEGLTVDGQKRVVTAASDGKTDKPGVGTHGQAERRLPAARPDEPGKKPASAETKADRPGVATDGTAEKRLPAARANEPGARTLPADATKK